MNTLDKIKLMEAQAVKQLKIVMDELKRIDEQRDKIVDRKVAAQKELDDIRDVLEKLNPRGV